MRRHVAAALTAAPSIFTARRTVIHPPKRPELRCDAGSACSWLMSSFLAASNCSAFVRICVLFTQASSARILSIDECVGGIRQSQLSASQIESSILSHLFLIFISQD